MEVVYDGLFCYCSAFFVYIAVKDCLYMENTSYVFVYSRKLACSEFVSRLQKQLHHIIVWVGLMSKNMSDINYQERTWYFRHKLLIVDLGVINQFLYG